MDRLCTCDICDDCLKRLREAGGNKGSSCSSLTTETTDITPSGESNRPDSTSNKEPSDTDAVAAPQLHLSSSGTLSSSSMPDISADESMSESAKTAALEESPSRGPSSLATDTTVTLGTSSPGTGPAVKLDAPSECGTRTLSDLTSIEAPDDGLPSPTATLALTKTTLGLTSPDQSDATEPPSSHPQSPMDVSEPLSSVDYSSDLDASVSLPPMNLSRSETGTDLPCSSSKVTDPSVSEESAMPKSSTSSEAKASDRSMDSFSECSSISSALPATGSSAESYPKSTTRDSAGSADTLADISETASPDTIKHISGADDGKTAGATAKKQAPTKRRRDHSRRQDKGPDDKPDSDTSETP